MPDDETGSKVACTRQRAIPEAVIMRLPIYHRYLSQLAKGEIERISSPELAAKIGITASQLRQDLSWFGSFGQQGYGYRVNDLLNAISKILGLETTVPMIIVGAGHLGRAIACYPNFEDKGFGIEAIFDNNPLVIGDVIGGKAIRPVSDLEEYLANNTVNIGIITTPAPAAQTIADMFVSGGVEGIWNFAPVSLKVPGHVVVEHVHISESLMMLSFKVRQKAGKIHRINNK